MPQWRPEFRSDAKIFADVRPPSWKRSSRERARKTVAEKSEADFRGRLRLFRLWSEFG